MDWGQVLLIIKHSFCISNNSLNHEAFIYLSVISMTQAFPKKDAL